MAYPCVACTKVEVPKAGTRCAGCKRNAEPPKVDAGASTGMRGPAPAFSTMFDRAKKVVNEQIRRLSRKMNPRDPATGTRIKLEYDPADTEASVQLAKALSDLEKSERQWLLAQKELADGMNDAELREFLLAQVDELPLSEAVEFVQEMTRRLNARKAA